MSRAIPGSRRRTLRVPERARRRGWRQLRRRIKNTKPTTQVGSLKTAWTTAKKAARVAVRWHDLRHTCVTRLLESGQTLPMIASIMGWSASTTVRMAQRYGHISTDARRVAMEAMNVPRRKVVERAFRDNAAIIGKDGLIH